MRSPRRRYANRRRRTGFSRLLPADQHEQFRQLWDEFEAHATPEARFANAVDRLQPLIQNAHAGWRKLVRSGARAGADPGPDGADRIVAAGCVAACARRHRVVLRGGCVEATTISGASAASRLGTRPCPSSCTRASQTGKSRAKRRRRRDRCTSTHMGHLDMKRTRTNCMSAKILYQNTVPPAKLLRVRRVAEWRPHQ